MMAECLLSLNDYGDICILNINVNQNKYKYIRNVNNYKNKYNQKI